MSASDAEGGEGGEGGGSSIWDGSHNAFVPAFHEYLGIAVVGLFALYYSRALVRWARGVSRRRGVKPGERASARRFGSINDPEVPEPESAPLLDKTSDTTRVKSDSTIGIQTGVSACQDELQCDVFVMQRPTFAISVAAHLTAAILFAAEAWTNRTELDAVGRTGKQLPGLDQLIWPFFYGASLVLVCADRFAGRAASSALQGFQLGAAMAVTIEFYDMLQNRTTVGTRGPCFVASFVPAAVIAVLVLVDVIRMRSSRLYEVNAEAKILEDMRGLVQIWVDSGGYTPEPEDEFQASAATATDAAAAAAAAAEVAKRVRSGDRTANATGARSLKFDEMNGSERCKASVAFAKTQLTTGLSVRLMFKMVMGVDAALMITGVIGNVLGMLGLVLAVLQIATAQDAAAEAAAAFAMDPTDNKPVHKIYAAGYGFIGPVAMLMVGMSMGSSFVEISGERMVCRLQRLCFVAICQQDASYFDENKVGELTSLMSTNPGMMRNAMTTSFASCIQNLVRTVLCLVFMLHGVSGKGSPTLFGYIIAMGMIPIVCICIMMVKAAGYSKRQTECAAVSTGISTEMITAIKTLVSFNMLGMAEEKYSKAARKTMGVGIEKDLLNASLIGIVYSSWLTMQGMVWILGGLEVHKGHISFTYLAAFAGLIGQVLQGVMGVFQIMPSMGTAAGASMKLFAVCLRHPKIDSRKRGAEPGNVAGDLTLTNIAFNYPSRPDKDVFKSLNLTIPAGKSVALVGKSGSGKSTILQLVQRFYDPDAGSVRLDGLDLRDLSLDWLHSRVGLVMQEPRLLSGTIHANITGEIEADIIPAAADKTKKTGASSKRTKSHATARRSWSGKHAAEETREPRDDVVLAAKRANAHDFIMAQPQGYFTVIGEGGATLSGGQKQRVAIARAVLKDPRVLLLDEATSALDSTSEHEVQKALDSVSKGRTTLTVAHRQSAIEKADLICVVDDGLIVESGTHKELLATGRIYQELYGSSSRANNL